MSITCVCKLDLHSSRLGKLLAQSDLSLDFEGGHLTLHDANTGGKMVIAIDSGELKSDAGAPVSWGCGAHWITCLFPLASRRPRPLT